MNFDEYQKKAAKYDLASSRDLLSTGFLEKILGLVGEAGEAADKFKKILRDKSGRISPDDEEAIAKELGDVLWYVSNIALYLNIPFSAIAKMNLDKLEGRLKRNKLHGEGDER